VSRISSAGLTRTNGFGFLFRSLILVSSAGQRSARLSHDELAGVTCRRKRGWRSSHVWISGVLRFA